MTLILSAASSFALMSSPFTPESITCLLNQPHRGTIISKRQLYATMFDRRHDTEKHNERRRQTHLDPVLPRYRFTFEAGCYLSVALVFVVIDIFCPTKNLFKLSIQMSFIGMRKHVFTLPKQVSKNDSHTRISHKVGMKNIGQVEHDLYLPDWQVPLRPQCQPLL